MRLRNITLGALLCLALFVVAAPVAAASSATQGYSEPAGKIQQQITPKSDEARKVAASTEGEGGSLPFTGLDIALVVAAGGVLLAMGLGIRRISRHEVA